MILSERLKEISKGYYIWHMDQELWQEISSLTEKELQTDDGEWNFILAELLISDNQGIYIPNKFYTNFKLSDWHIKAHDYMDLSDSDNELYWCAWEELRSHAYYIHDNKKYVLYQDGDLWAVHYKED